MAISWSVELKNGVVAVVLVIAMTGSAGAGFLVGSNVFGNITVGNPTAKTTKTTCHITGVTLGVRVRIVAIDYSNNSTVPVSNASVTGQNVVYCNDERQVTTFRPTKTNSSGWVGLSYGGVGIYYVNITYPNSNLTYSLSIPARPVTATYVVFNISSGNVTTHFCAFNYHCVTGSTGA